MNRMRRLSRSGQLLPQLVKTLSLVWTASRYWTLTWIVLLAIQGVLPAATVYLTGVLVDSLVGVMGAGLAWETIERVLLPVGLMAAVLLLAQCLQSVIDWVRTAQSELVQDHVNGLIHAQSIRIDLGCYESPDYHDHLNRARSGASNRSLALLENLGNLLQSSVTLLSMIAILLPYGIWIPLMLSLSTLPAFYVVIRLNKRYHRWWRRTTIDRRWLDYYDQLLTNSAYAAEMRLFKLGPYFQAAYQRLRHRLRTENINLAREQSLGRLAAGLITLLAAGATVAWMGRQVLLGLMTLGDLALFYQAFNQGQGLMRSFIGNLGQVYRNSLFIADLFDFLNLQPSIVDPSNPLPVPNPLQQGICFRDVTFRYPGSDRAVLEGFNLTIPAGKVVAIVGDNGAGKSTLIKLLCRFYDPAAGRIELDGKDLRSVSVEALQRQITVLFQSPIPYYVTASENIRLGDLTANPTVEEVETAARTAGIHNNIQRLPQGYESMLGKWFPGGNDFSGGEWQRLALARSFLRRAQLIILDEPTSAMDPWAEFDWLDRFRVLASDRTAVVITHRFTLAMRADIIHVMRDGQIVESGSHQELLDQDGLYAQSWKSQMQANIDSKSHEDTLETYPSGALEHHSPNHCSTDNSTKSRVA
jgi:ATP-binding cassette, subfamily B, bacterial